MKKVATLLWFTLLLYCSVLTSCKNDNDNNVKLSSNSLENSTETSSSLSSVGEIHNSAVESFAISEIPKSFFTEAEDFDLLSSQIALCKFGEAADTLTMMIEKSSTANMDDWIDFLQQLKAADILMESCERYHLENVTAIVMDKECNALDEEIDVFSLSNIGMGGIQIFIGYPLDSKITTGQMTVKLQNGEEWISSGMEIGTSITDGDEILTNIIPGYKKESSVQVFAMTLPMQEVNKIANDDAPVFLLEDTANNCMLEFTMNQLERGNFNKMYEIAKVYEQWNTIYRRLLQFH